MFFLSNHTCRTGFSRFGKLPFPKSADCDYSEICRNKVTAYILARMQVSGQMPSTIITMSDHAVGMDDFSSHEDMSGRFMKPRSSFR